MTSYGALSSARAFVWWDDKTQYLYKRLNKCVLQSVLVSPSLRCKWAISLESTTEMAYYHHFPSGWRGLPDIPSLISRLSSVAHHSSSFNFAKSLLLPVRISPTLWHWWLYFSFFPLSELKWSYSRHTTTWQITPLSGRPGLIWNRGVVARAE